MSIKRKMIQGKWNKNKYEIIELIGMGGIGEVYKVFNSKNRNYYALKISNDLHSITKEANMLEKFKGLDGIPAIIDIDDYKEMGYNYYFIVLEYIKGTNLKEYFKRYRITIKELLSITIIIGEVIKKIHRKGYIFGDLKPENIMVDEKNNRIRIIDLGGVCKIGTSLKEFTPVYDRSKWNIGSRKADTDYDLFALSMLMTNHILNNNKIHNMKIHDIITELRGKKIDNRLINLLVYGLLQRKINFYDFVEKLKNIYSNPLKYQITGNRVDHIVNSFFLGSLICFLIMLTIIFTG